jgi:hypothetical protein
MMKVYCSAIRQGRIVRLKFTIIEAEIFKRYAESIWGDGDVMNSLPGWRLIRWPAM